MHINNRNFTCKSFKSPLNSNVHLAKTKLYAKLNSKTFLERHKITPLFCFLSMN